MSKFEQLPTKFALRSTRVVLPHRVAAATVLVDGDRIGAVLGYDVPVTVPITDVGDRVIMPGMIDVHVHLNDPGREWEGFESGTKSAVAGGVTTVVDMPLNSEPVTIDIEALRLKTAAMAGNLWSNCALHAGVTPESLPHLDELLTAGCVAGKAFMVETGIDDFQMADEATLRAGMAILAKHGRPLLAHAELALGDGLVKGDRRQFANYLASRPPEWEVEAIRMLIRLCRETGCAVHVVHLSAVEGLPLLREARAEGLPISVETGPHYLYFTSEEIPDGATPYKCSPPIRSAENRETLWAALLAGDIDLIASDHSPCSPDLKNLETGDFQTAWGGMSCLQLSLPVLYTQLKGRLAGMDDTTAFRLLATWLAENPATLLGWDREVGRIWPAFKADLVVWEPECDFVVTGADLHHRHKVTAYEGETLYGKVAQTYVNGRLAFDDGQFSEPCGIRIDAH